MILSRIAEHLRQQNWAAVGLELIIVVLGVFIGIQVSNWNAAQAEKRLGRLYTERLTSDLRSDLAAHQAVISYYTTVLESIERTETLLRDPRSDAQELIKHAYRATEVANAPRKRATWDEIVSSGDTGLLPRRALDAGISDYFAIDSMRDTFELLLATDYRRRLRSTLPLAVQKSIRAGCSDQYSGSTLVIGFVPECTIAVDAGTLAAAAAALRADPRIAEALTFQYSVVFSSLSVLRNNVGLLETALAALDDAQGAGAEVTP